jgi:hypothetical protein
MIQEMTIELSLEFLKRAFEKYEIHVDNICSDFKSDKDEIKRQLLSNASVYIEEDDYIVDDEIHEVCVIDSYWGDPPLRNKVRDQFMITLTGDVLISDHYGNLVICQESLKSN